jgi:HSP20 family protein
MDSEHRHGRGEEDVMTAITSRDWPARWREWLTAGFPERLRALELPELDDWFERDGLRIEEYKDGDSLVVKAEMPGIDPETDVEITISDNTLHIRAERKEQREEGDKEKGSYRSEFRYGRFSRSLTLPAGTTEEDVKASYNDGILEVRLPIREEVAAKQKIPISRS